MQATPYQGWLVGEDGFQIPALTNTESPGNSSGLLAALGTSPP